MRKQVRYENNVAVTCIFIEKYIRSLLSFFFLMLKFFIINSCHILPCLPPGNLADPGIEPKLYAYHKSELLSGGGVPGWGLCVSGSCHVAGHAMRFAG